MWCAMIPSLTGIPQFPSWDAFDHRLDSAGYPWMLWSVWNYRTFIILLIFALSPSKADSHNQVSRGINSGPVTSALPADYRKHPPILRGSNMINILGLFELSSCDLAENGRLELFGAQLAVKMINSQRIIPGYRLQLIFNDTMCSVGHGINAYYRALFFGPKIHFLLGPSHDEVAIPLARATPYFAQLQISAGATSPALSDRKHFRYFFRTVAPDQSHNEARRAFLHHFGWRFAAAINENQEAYALAMNEIVRTLAGYNITFRATGSIGINKIQEQLRIFKEKDVRIIFGAFSLDFAKRMFCEAYHLGLYGERYVWFIPGSYPRFWWRLRDNSTTCTVEQMETAIEGYITVTTSDSLMNNRTSSAGIRYDQFTVVQNDLQKAGASYSPQALAFDAVWTFAFMIQESRSTLDRKGLRLENFSYKNREMTEIFKDTLSRLDFDGISGPIRFYGSDRVGVSVFRQHRVGEMKTIAFFNPEDNFLHFNCSICEQISWIASGARVPADRRVVLPVIETVTREVLYIIGSIALLGILLALSFLCFNILFHSQKFIKLSSPKLNNTTALGCCLVYASVISLGIDYGVTGESSIMKSICQVRIFLFSTGFSVAFGSLFLKTFRVHQIFRKASGGVIKSKLLRDNQLLCGVGCLFTIDCIFLFIWFVSDPIQVELMHIGEQTLANNPDVVLRRKLEVCSSEYMTTLWLPAIYISKGLMLLAGIFLTFETRHVKIPALNDSQAVGLSIYNVVICSIIAFALTQIIVEQHTLRFILVSGLTIATTSGTLCFLFLPKIMVVLKNSGDDPVLSSSGLKVECNTRRLAVEDPRERFTRAEIQNRVYKRDLVELDTDMDKLEIQVQIPVVPRIKISEELLMSLPEFYVDDEITVERFMKAERERDRIPTPAHERIQNLRALLPLLKRNRLDVSSSLSDRSDSSSMVRDEFGGSTTMVMETLDGNITILVKNNQKQQPHNSAGMVKFRKAMVKYKFIAGKPQPEATDSLKKRLPTNGLRQEFSTTEPSTSES
ncbi:gamma-aminobutyric acid type B receptor subunit 2-like [Paramacrobiotus metropolitanus]|uniref:gamma-aminobutyric acid type B receptor subunit 2-like n=1 Tax=Paramacrobiotus metropolitanus TaxID=2943436 RepID=UPI002445C156|nr:gamma-aminobutyric acid type B receptor subunit 2-like [Paramacrobiotus metropolitanus]